MSGSFGKTIKTQFVETNAGKAEKGKARGKDALAFPLTRGGDIDTTTGTEQTNYTASQPMWARPYKHYAWQNKYTECMPLWCARTGIDPNSREVKLTTLASLPVLNYLCEEASTARTDSVVYDSTVEAVRARQHQLASPLATSTVEQFLAAWSFMGAMRNDLISGFGEPPPMMGNQQRLINVDVAGRGRLFNVFAPSPKVGDCLYFITKKVQSPFEYFWNPEGEPVARRVPSEKSPPILQTFGWCSSDGSVPSFNTSTSDTEEPTMTNVDFWDRDKRITQVYQITEYDADSDRLIVRPPTGDAEDVPQLEWDMYSQGSISRVGYVNQVSRSADLATILKGHRDHNAMITLPVLEVMMGIGCL